MDLTVIILTYNEEKNIKGCLDSLKGLNIPIYVVDSFSNDATIDILKERKIKYIQHPFEHYAAQRNWAQANNPYKTDWVLHLDAGERLTPALRTWLKEEYPKLAGYDGYMFSRRTEFMGRWIKHGGHYPNYHLRLFDTSKGHCENKVYDQHFVVEGKTQALAKGLDMVDVVSDNLKDFCQSHLKWAAFEALEIISSETKKGEVEESLSGSPIEKRRWMKNNVFQKTPLLWRSLFYFCYRYFVRLGFLDGKKGLIFHFLQGFWFRFLVDSIVIEIKDKQSKGEKTLSEIASENYGVDINKLLKT
jgi:glycosyltransferase involved in cell wall biosynthesis